MSSENNDQNTHLEKEKYEQAHVTVFLTPFFMGRLTTSHGEGGVKGRWKVWTTDRNFVSELFISKVNELVCLPIDPNFSIA